ncbi:radial spoke head 10 homolog B-like [Dysidea avara]|uniref:radial spoke head 10 homolog B-like n=1 Tax=Dysidea avara TaxID=196820 RepID=UPI003327AE3C
MDDKLKAILSQLDQERKLSYRRGTICLTDILDKTSPLSNVIIESCEEEQVVDGSTIGKEKFRNEGEYKGAMGEGHVMHGTGYYQWTDKVSYEGEFNNCHITGDGSYVWPDGSSYIGQVMDGLRDGWGCYKCAGSHVTYTGSWKNGKRNGKGKIVYDEEGTSFYEGEWKDHVRFGQGYRRYSSGNVYEGEWCDDKRHGHGTMYWYNTNEQYTGQWKCGIQEGHGEHIWFMEQTDNSQYPLCNHYVGNWSHGLKHGMGSFYYASGAVYEGEWHHNKKHGRGRYISQSGTVTEGLFRDDQLIEEGRDRPITPISKITSGAGGSDSGCGSSTAIFIKYIQSLLPEGLAVEEEFQQVYSIILCYISQLKKIYHYYSNLGLPCDSATPYSQKTLTRMQLWQLLKDCQLCQIGCNLIEVDDLLVLQDGSPTSCLSHHDPNSTYLMREFLQLLVSISQSLFWDSIGGDVGFRLSRCLDHLLKHYLMRHACKVGGLLYQSPEHMILSTVYQSKCWEVYKIIGKKRPVSMRDFLLMMNDCGLIGEYLTSSDVIDYITADNSRASTDPPHCYNLEILITFLEFCEVIISCALCWHSRHLQHPTRVSPVVPTVKVESSHSHSTGGSDPLLINKSSHNLTGNKHLAQSLPAYPAHSGASIESASSQSGKRANANHPPAVAVTTAAGGTTGASAAGGGGSASEESRLGLTSPLKVPSKPSVGVPLSPIEETKSHTSVESSPTHEETGDNRSHDHVNTPDEQDEMVICQESLKEMLEEYIFPHYGVNNVQ